ncbi:MAG: methyltransferase domain-containing protein [SAR324 cluster bacterium]|nr:methyltransferase domain-containing protein [SAR324 cluster bacterium]
MTNRNAAEVVAETYYDSSDADIFYERVWGGEDIHIGIYGPGQAIFESSRKTVALMASKLELNANVNVLDLGAGYGGAARYLAQSFGCKVNCLNLSQVQNARNQLLSRQQDLEHLVTVTHGSFESIPADDNSIDVIWSQDAFLHSGDKCKVIQEIARVLKPNGELIFTDPMQADDCPPDVLQPVFDRLSLDSMGSFSLYRQLLEADGLAEIESQDLTAHLGTHYASVKKKLEEGYEELKRDISTEYLDKMIMGLQYWVAAEASHYLAWGILHYRKRDGEQ